MKDEVGNNITEEANRWYIKVKEKFKKPTGQKGERKVKKSGWCDEEKTPKGAKVKTIKRGKINPEWDKTLKYIPRKDRPEWNVVGLLGQVAVKKGEVIGKDWIKMKKISNNVNLYLVK